MHEPQDSRQVPVAIVGVGALTPGAHTPDEFWRMVCAGRDMLTDVPANRWLIEDYYDQDPEAADRTYGRRGAFLSEVDFDPIAYGIPPNALSATDTAQLLALLATEQVMADVAEGCANEPNRDRTSVVIGVGTGLELLHTMSNRMQRPVWLKALREEGIPEPHAQAICDRIAEHYVPWQEATFPGSLGNVVAGRIANTFDLHGSNYTVDAACASSLAAISAAVNELSVGAADFAITGGVDTLNDITTYMCFSETPAMSPTGDCRPFSDAADGTILGEAVVMFALKRLSDAERAGDRIYAVIRGIGAGSDGRGTAIYAPLAEGQARAMRRAYAAAGYGPDSVELVEAHGTGTRGGDSTEFASLRSVFDASGRAHRQWCALGSVKSQLGHTKSAAGAAGMLKAALSLHHKILPPTIKVDRPNPELDLANSPCYLNTQTRPWIRGAAHPRRAAVSSFGFGGTNFHLTLEEYVPRSAARVAAWSRTAASELVLLSAPDPAQLRVKADALVDESRPLAELASASQRDFDPAAAIRLAVIASDSADLENKLAQASTALDGDGPRTLPGITLSTEPANTGKLALLFGGQGSQYVGMGADLAMHLPQARAVWDRTADVPTGDRTLPEVVFPIPAFTEEEREAQQAMLTETSWAQPALAVQSIAQLAVLREVGIEPDCVAGHSLGELVALHAAGALSEEAVIRIARRRGELMAEVAQTPGRMLAVATAVEDVEQILSEVDGDVWIANHNSPRQVVLSGGPTEIGLLAKRFADIGVTTRLLNTHTAFHSPIVAAARKPFEEFLRTIPIQPPRIDVYGNASARPYPDEPESIRRQLAEQLAAPVRFVAEIEQMYAAGVRVFVEVGAGSSLTGLVGEILADRPHLAVSLDHKRRDGMTSFQQALGTLAVAGLELNFDALWAPYERPNRTPARKPAMRVAISGRNYGTPYPPEGGSAALPPPIAVDSSAEPVLPAVGGSAMSVAPQPRSGQDGPLGELPGSDRPVSTAAPTADVPPVTDEWLRAFDETQQRIAQAYENFQRITAESNMAFLAMSETALEALAGGMTGETRARPTQEILVDAGTPAALPPTPLAQHDTAPSAAEFDVVPAMMAPPSTAADPSGSGAREGDLRALVVEVVADKTGYPVDVIELDMELQADLGIDSIKRVEILSALRESRPGLPDLDPAQLDKFRTIREISDALDDTRPAAFSERAPDIAPPVNAPPDTAPPVTRAVSTMLSAPAPGLALPGLGQCSIVVTDDGGGVAERVVAHLSAHGVAARVSAEVGDADGVILLHGLRDVRSVDEAIAVNWEAFECARAAARAKVGVLVTVQDTGGDFGISGRQGDRAWLGGLAGLARVAAREWPVAARAIDCERGARDPDAIAAALTRELLHGGTQPDIGLRADGTRWALRDVIAPSAEGRGRIGRDSVIVATGGGRGVTAAALLALAEGRAPSLVLLGRTPLVEEPPEFAAAADERELIKLLADRGQASPAELRRDAARVLAVREIKSTVDSLKAMGFRARYVPVDACDGDALAAALDEVRSEWGAITGVVHAAGVLADSPLADKTDEQFGRVFDVKVLGLQVLLSATERDPLDTVCVFSSVAGRFGNPGQCDYAMANEVMAQVVSTVRARRPDCVVRSLAWGPWDGGMVDATLRDRFRDAGVPLLPMDVGARAFVREIDSGEDAGSSRVTLVAGSRPNPLGEHALAGEALVTADSHPYLADHALHGTPVLPLALGAEWFTGLARSWRPDADGIVLRDLAVLKRVELPRLGDGHRFAVRGEHEPAGTLNLRLDGADSGAMFRSVAVDEEPSDRPWTPPDGLKNSTVDELYDGRVLFHGSAFRCIESLEMLGEAGASAAVKGVQAMGWPGDGWHTDVAAVDAGLQLALLWADRAVGGAFLPTSVGEFRVHRFGCIADARCVVRARSADGLRAVCDVAVLGGDGTPSIELRNVTLVRRSDSEGK